MANSELMEALREMYGAGGADAADFIGEAEWTVGDAGPYNSADKVGMLTYIPIEELYPHPDNPRKELGDLTELAESIKAKGVMQNLTVVPRAEGGYTVIIGHRRSAAARLAGLDRLPCVIVEMSEREQVATMLLENMQRVDLTAFEQAQGMQLMMDLGETVESISEKTGFSKKTVKHRLEMAKLNKKTLKEVSARQVTMDDFDKLSKIKDMKKRNEVLKQIGTYNFNNAVERAIQEELIAEKMPLFVAKVLSLGAKKMKEDDRWSSKFERIADIDVKREDPEQKLVANKYQKDPLFYNVREYNGYLEIYRKRPKEPAVKRSKEEIERARAIDECKKELKSMTETAKSLRRKFVQEMVMHAKNREAMLTGCVGLLECIVMSYMYSVNARSVLEFVGEKTSDAYGKNTELFQSLLRDKPGKVVPAIILLCFENDASSKYYLENYDGFPTHNKNIWLDRCYDWLISCGYEMSDDEIGLRDGTHEIFKRADNGNK